MKRNRKPHTQTAGEVIARALTTEDIPRYLGSDGARIDLPNGWYAVVTVESDGDLGPPWEEHDGHGPVREARTIDYSDRGAWVKDKRAGERLLSWGGRNERAYLYDFAEAVRIARRDGWSCGVLAGGETCSRGQWHRTNRSIAACAAESDFQRLRAWCANEWEWITVSATLFDASGEPVEGDSLGGVESDGDYWRECAAEMVNGLAAGIVLPNDNNTNTQGGE